MQAPFSFSRTQGGFSWEAAVGLVVLVLGGMMIKNEVFPATGPTDLALRYGEPIAKTGIPRPK